MLEVLCSRSHSWHRQKGNATLLIPGSKAISHYHWSFTIPQVHFKQVWFFGNSKIMNKFEWVCSIIITSNFELTIMSMLGISK